MISEDVNYNITKHSERTRRKEMIKTAWGGTLEKCIDKLRADMEKIEKVEPIFRQAKADTRQETNNRKPEKFFIN